jgi:hypothetical protein
MKPTPTTLVQAIQDRERSLPWRERPTRRETLEALLECHARAVAERDAQRVAEKRERAIRFTLGNLNASRNHQTSYEAVAEAYDRLNPPTPSSEPPTQPPRG